MISVIVPVYKVEAYLRACVDSILAQTFTDFELILVDDGSPDACGEICDEYAERDSRVHVIHQENGGLSAARNAGIDWAFANSDSQWIAFIDSDDVILPNYFYNMYQAANNHNAQVTACQMIAFQDNTSLLPTHPTGSVSCLTGHDAVLDLYSDLPRIYVSACCKLYEKQLFEKIRFPVGKLHEDQAVTPIVLSRAAIVASLDYPLYYYRLREDSITHRSFSVKRYDDIAGVDQCIQYFTLLGQQDLAAAAQKQRTKLIALYSLFARKAGVYDEVPRNYKITTCRALGLLRQNMTDDKYSYYLAMFHPKLLRPHAYLRKAKQFLHIPFM